MGKKIHSKRAGWKLRMRFFFFVINFTLNLIRFSFFFFSSSSPLPTYHIWSSICFIFFLLQFNFKISRETSGWHFFHIFSEYIKGSPLCYWRWKMRATRQFTLFISCITPPGWKWDCELLYVGFLVSDIKCEKSSWGSVRVLQI